MSACVCMSVYAECAERGVLQATRVMKGWCALRQYSALEIVCVCVCARARAMWGGGVAPAVAESAWVLTRVHCAMCSVLVWLLMTPLPTVP